MVFALDNADAASEVTDLLAQALTLSETAPRLKLARLLLASDILANATAPVGAWKCLGQPGCFMGVLSWRIRDLAGLLAGML